MLMKQWNQNVKHFTKSTNLIVKEEDTNQVKWNKHCQWNCTCEKLSNVFTALGSTSVTFKWLKGPIVKFENKPLTDPGNIQMSKNSFPSPKSKFLNKWQVQFHSLMEQVCNILAKSHHFWSLQAPDHRPYIHTYKHTYIIHTYMQT